jgi:hypothetical protein
MVGERCRIKDRWPGSRRLRAWGVTRRRRGCVDGCVERRHAWGARGRERPVHELWRERRVVRALRRWRQGWCRWRWHGRRETSEDDGGAAWKGEAVRC